MKKSLGPQILVYPTPVFLVGTFDENGQPNIMNAAWGGVCCSEPPCVAVSVRPGRHTFAGLLKHKAFSINIPSASQIAEADLTGIASGASLNKFESCEWTAVPSDLVQAPYVQECPVTIELELAHAFNLGTHTLFIGEIKDTKIAEHCLDDAGKPDILKVQPMLFDTGQKNYHAVGAMLGKAYNIGKKLLK